MYPLKTFPVMYMNVSIYICIESLSLSTTSHIDKQITRFYNVVYVHGQRWNMHNGPKQQSIVPINELNSLHS